MAHSLLSAIKSLGTVRSTDAGAAEKQAQILSRRSEVSGVPAYRTRPVWTPSHRAGQGERRWYLLDIAALRQLLQVFVGCAQQFVYLEIGQILW